MFVDVLFLRNAYIYFDIKLMMAVFITASKPHFVCLLFSPARFAADVARRASGDNFAHRSSLEGAIRFISTEGEGFTPACPIY